MRTIYEQHFAEILELSSVQHGVFSLEQWLACGLSRDQLKRRMKTGEIVMVFYKVYRFRTAPWSFEAAVMAGCLKAGRGSAAIGATAGSMWGLMGHSNPIHVGTGRRIDDIDGYMFHRVALTPEEIVVRGGVPVTDIPRFLTDAAGMMHPLKAGRLLDKAHRLGLTSLDELSRRVEQEARQGRNGISVMRWLLQDRDPTDARAKSNLEIRFYRFLDEYGYPTPLKNVPIDVGNIFPWEADCYWPPPRKLVVELLTFGSHGYDQQTFNKDFDKDLDLRVAGYHLVYVTEKQLQDKRALHRKLRTFFEPSDFLVKK